MVDVLWWLQAAGAITGLLLTLGGLLAGLYATFRETPKFVRRLTGYARIERKVDQLLEDHRISQELQKQQAEEFNHLASCVGDNHDIPAKERPYVNVEKIDRELLGDDTPDFTSDD